LTEITLLFNPAYLFRNVGAVLALTALIVIGKFLVITFLGFILPRLARTTLVVATGNKQIGEFSFILGQAGLALGLLGQDQYSLILAGALLSITLNPAMFSAIYSLEKSLRRLPGVWRLLDCHGPFAAPLEETLQDHVVLWGMAGWDGTPWILWNRSKSLIW
jgi:CPA2 family monovalent cation:H+ antiporter-2